MELLEIKNKNITVNIKTNLAQTKLKRELRNWKIQLKKLPAYHNRDKEMKGMQDSLRDRVGR